MKSNPSVSCADSSPIRGAFQTIIIVNKRTAASATALFVYFIIWDNEVNVQLLEARQDSTLVFVFDEFLDFWRLEGFDEFLDFRTVFITFTDDEDVGIR